MYHGGDETGNHASTISRASVYTARPMRRELVATVGKQERTLVIENGTNGHYRIVLDGRSQVVDAARVGPGTWSLLVDGRSYIVDLDERRGRTVVLTRATETPVKVEDALHKRLANAVGVGRAGAGSGEVVAAPIAGRVVKLLVGVGDDVVAGQPVAVLEAMKMENEILAERGGKVSALHVQPGVTVDTQDPMVTLA